MIDIKIPKSNSDEVENIAIEKNMVIVGANGSGKTRLGSEIEQKNESTKRISAQRYLQFHDTVNKKAHSFARSELKQVYKNQSPVQPQNDFENVLETLFSEESESGVSYLKAAKEKKTKKEITPPTTAIEKVLKVWKEVFPYRELKLENDSVKITINEVEISGMELSDGEKIGLYLIAQVILADEHILIIDEPEIHLHKSLMVRLWSKLEQYKSGSIFIYITHDLEFAVSKASEILIWTQSFNNNRWKWQQIDKNEEIPENLYLEILGSGANILLVEGKRGSLDIQIYQAYYEKFTVLPGGGSEEVIRAVKGLKKHELLHNKKIFGLIDRDFRLSNQIKSLREKDNIFSIELFAVENLLLVPCIIRLVCKNIDKLKGKEDDIIQELRINYKNFLEKPELDFYALKQQRMNLITEKFSKINSQKSYNEFKKSNSIFEQLDKLPPVKFPDSSADLEKILKFYRQKGLINTIEKKFGLGKGAYYKKVINLLNSEERKKVTICLKPYLPTLED